MIISKIKALFQPELFHGDLKKSPYFEGWYYKVKLRIASLRAYAIRPYGT